MLNVQAADVKKGPFPHVLTDAILLPDLFERLKADFPDGGLFHQNADEVKSVGSRAGKGSGFDIYRGDAAYDQLIERSSAWAEFDSWINSAAFVEKYLELFGAYADAMKILADVTSESYDASYIEHRKVLTENKTAGERLSGLAHSLTRSWQHRRKVTLFSRLDITRATGGYAKPPHCDRPNRLCSLIIYFTDAGKDGLEGGELQVFQAKTPVAIEKTPRHPRAEEVEVVATVQPKPNRGIFFPCCNNSYHGVTAIRSSNVPRDFLYINISARAGNIW